MRLDAEAIGRLDPIYWPLDEHDVIARIEPGVKWKLPFRLAASDLEFLIVRLVASEEIELILWSGIDAMREERCDEGKIGFERARGVGKQFELHAGPGICGHFWLVTLKNRGKHAANVAVRVWAEGKP